MAKVRVRATAEDFEKSGTDKGDFVLPKPGLYVLTCTECEPGFTKKEGTDEPDKSKPYLKFTYQITGVGRDEAQVTENYGNVWDYMSFSAESGWKRAEVLIAYGYAEKGTQDFDQEIDTDEVINRKVLARIKHQKGKNKNPDSAKIARLFQYGSDPTEDEGSSVDYGGSETFGDDESSPFAEGEAETTPEPDEQEAAKYNFQNLEEKDLKSLGAILTEEFAGDPKALIVKVNGKLDSDATKKAVIDAIMDAQGGGSTEPEEEDPF